MPTVKVFDTMSRKVTDVPRDNPVTMYTCGPTVYSEPHIGNWRAFIFYDTLVRTLQANKYAVERTMNLTDVGHLVGDGDEGEDKLQKAANKQRKTAWDVAAEYIKSFAHGMKDLNMVQPNHVVRATDMIDEQIAMVKLLETMGYAYPIDDGVYFDTSKLDNYGRLAQLKLDDQQEGARVQVNDQKRNASDFALWKLSPKDAQRDMEWDSPWGTGFPGWHLECSVIAEQTLGKSITIHTGGIDHVPVHHPNEIAQSEAAHGQEFSKLWVHNEHMLIEGEKMSKSLKNDFTLQDIKDKDYDLLDFRTLILMAKYRTQQNFTWQSLQDARTLRLGLKALAARVHQPSSNVAQKDETDAVQLISEAHTAMHEAFSNDLNSPEALSALGSLKDALDTLPLSSGAIGDLSKCLSVFDQLSGLKISDIENISPENYERIKQRDTLRTAKQFAEADRLRNELTSDGIDINDTSFGAIWSYDS